jgi:hypothetical protein
MPILTTPDLCFVLHNDDGKGGYKIGRDERNVGKTNGKKKERTERNSEKKKKNFVLCENASAQDESRRLFQ